MKRSLAISIIQDKLYNRVHDIVGHSALNTINDVAYHVGKLEMKDETFYILVCKGKHS